MSALLLVPVTAGCTSDGADSATTTSTQASVVMSATVERVTGSAATAVSDAAMAATSPDARSAPAAPTAPPFDADAGPRRTGTTAR